MEKVIDVNFNFELYDVLITESLNNFNIAKEQYFSGEETLDGLNEKLEKLTSLIDTCLRLMETRNKLINNYYFNDGNHNKKQLVEEKRRLIKQESWYKRLKESVEKEGKFISTNELGLEDEPDFNQ